MHSCNTKKHFKKLQKVARDINIEFGAKLSGTPTSFVLLSNAGLVNGATTDAIDAVLPENLRDEFEIVLIPNKPFCVIRCRNPDLANDLVESLSGKPCFDFLSGQPVYAGFLDSDIPTPVLRFGDLPPALRIFENFVSDEDEDIWLKLCDFENEIGGSMKNRQVDHFGYSFDYSINGVHRNKPLENRPLPENCMILLNSLVEKGLLSNSQFPNQLTVNRYALGAGIPAHCDTHSMFGPQIVIVSLGADVVMEFEKGDDIRLVRIPRKSVTIMEGESRYAWTHSITPRKYDLFPNGNKSPRAVVRGTRVSFTFRFVRPDIPCDCAFPLLCDSRNTKSDLELNNGDAFQLEKLHVHEVYDKIAPHFSETRHSQWPKIREFLESLPPHSLVADVGCGNGKYMKVESRKDLNFIGCDYSHGLLSICHQKGFETLQSDCLTLPFRSNTFFEAAICIAVIHHLSTALRRKKAIEQLLDIVKPGGRVLVYVWAREQHLVGKSKYIKEGKTPTSQIEETVTAGDSEVRLTVHTNRSNFKEADVLVPWKTQNKEERRYYHVFQKGELESVVEGIERVEILDQYYDEGNWCIVLNKL